MRNLILPRFCGSTTQQTFMEPLRAPAGLVAKEAETNIASRKISHTSSKNRAHLRTKPLLKGVLLMVPRGA